jgi:hypothetical protein
MAFPSVCLQVECASEPMESVRYECALYIFRKLRSADALRPCCALINRGSVAEPWPCVLAGHHLAAFASICVPAAFRFGRTLGFFTGAVRETACEIKPSRRVGFSF